MIYVKFNNHERILYSLWKGHGEIKKKPVNIFGVEKRTHFKFPTIKENTNTHVWSKNHGSRYLYSQVSLFKVSQMYTSQMYSVYPHCKIYFFIMIYVYSCLYYYLCICWPIC